MNLSEDAIIKALFNAGAVGYLVAYNATIAGAEGGCQAEVGTASAMAASAVTELMGGTPPMCLSAASGAIANLLGLVCDPIGGLVEAPCQQRNAMGVSNGLICSEIALSGIKNIVPFDEVVSVMYNVGRSIPHELRETAIGGLASAPSACSRCGKCG
jgi:L-serine dehydratase